MQELSNFHERRRQTFLDEKTYEATKANQERLINVSLGNLEFFERGSRDYAGELRMVFLEKLWLWMLEYTAGLPIYDIQPKFTEIAADFAAWNAAYQDFQMALAEKYPQDGPYRYLAAPDFENLSDYENILQFLSIAILIRDHESAKVIGYTMRSHLGRDALFDELIEPYVEIEATADECALAAPYEMLAEAFREEDEEMVSKSIVGYLNAWYPAMKHHPRWYNGHLTKSPEGWAPYYGYWAFEAAAVAYLLGIDDTSFNSIVYPRDLVAYAAEARAKDEMGQFDKTVEAGRVEGGRPCPRTGYWESPARAGSRRMFSLGEIMPVFTEADFGLTIWHWSPDQNS